MYQTLVLIILLTLGIWGEDIRIAKTYQDNMGRQFIELKPSPNIKIDRISLDNGDTNSTLSPKHIKKSTTVYFLIDSSFPMKEAFKSGIKPLIKKLYSKKSANQKWIVSNFDINLEMLYNEYVSSSSLFSKLDSLEIKGQRTELWKNSEKAIEFLKKITDDSKKILVICSDGESEDQAYKIETTIEESLKNGITIISLGYRDNGTKKTNFIQNMERVANDTHGKFWNANTHNKLGSSFEQEFNKFISLLSNKNILMELPQDAIKSTESGKQNFTLNVKHDNKISKLNFSIDVPKIYTPKKSFWDKYKYYILGITLFLLSLLIFLLTRKKEEPPLPIEPIVPVVPITPIEPVIKDKEYIAYFESLGGTKHYVYKLPSIIGSNGDVVIDGEFISREHALIEFEDGHFIITDRESKNGLFVNNREIDKEKLRDEDKVSFGPYDTIFKIRRG